MSNPTKTLKPPYTSVSDIDAFFERVQTIAEPQSPKKVDSAWIESYQFETAHPSAIPSMLRWLGVIGEDGESTGVWNDLRVDGTRQTTLARLVKDAYQGVFDAVDVEDATARDLRGGFVSAYSIGDPARHIKCFLALCRHAGIRTAEEATARGREPKQNGETTSRLKPVSTPQGSSKAKVTTRHKPRPRDAPEGGGINITLTVEIPATWTEDQIRLRIAAVSRALEPLDASDT